MRKKKADEKRARAHRLRVDGVKERRGFRKEGRPAGSIARLLWGHVKMVSFFKRSLIAGGVGTLEVAVLAGRAA